MTTKNKSYGSHISALESVRDLNNLLEKERRQLERAFGLSPGKNAEVSTGNLGLVVSTDEYTDLPPLLKDVENSIGEDKCEVLVSRSPKGTKQTFHYAFGMEDTENVGILLHRQVWGNSRTPDDKSICSKDTNRSEDDEQEFETDARIVLNYTERSHVLLGDFKDRFKFFRIEMLRSAEWAHFNGQLLIGVGWVIRQDSIEWLKIELNHSGITFDEVTFDQKRRKDHIRKLRKYQRQYGNLKKTSTPKKESCPYILFKYNSINYSEVCNKSFFKNGMCNYHWKKSQLQVVR